MTASGYLLDVVLLEADARVPIHIAAADPGISLDRLLGRLDSIISLDRLLGRLHSIISLDRRFSSRGSRSLDLGSLSLLPRLQLAGLDEPAA